jgi:hypothetical protein
MEKFERLIEYVINDEEAKARELFHEIVVEKSRDIYENLMSEEDDELGGDAADDFITDIESDEQGMDMDSDDDSDSMDMDSDDDDAMDNDGDDAEEEVEELEDRVVDVEDKLDELMAEFETLMTSEEGEDSVQDMDMDDMGDTDSEESADEDVLELDEALELQSAPKPTESEEGFVHSESTVAANSGAKGIDADPVRMGDSDEKGRKAPDAKDMGHTTHVDSLSSAPSATDSEPSEVNTQSTFN